jgi:hypothetical protein
MSLPHRKQQRNAPLPTLLDAQVLRLREWAQLAGVSLRTARRILASGSGPATVRLSARRRGVSVGAHRAWLASRQERA